MSDPLATYLHDHLAGAELAIDLLEWMKDRPAPLGSFAVSLLGEVKQDRATLEQFANDLGAGSSVVKNVTAWMSEKASRIKLAADPSDELGEFQALESLALGIQGKLGLWRALEAAAGLDPRLRSLDFKELIARATTQYAQVEERRLALAPTALAPAKT